MPKLLLCLLFVCILAAKSSAEESNQPTTNLINALASSDAKQVEMARGKLIEMGDNVVNQLESYKTEDQRVATSIKYILNRICNYYIRIDPKREKQMASPGNGIQAILTIKNNTTKTVKMFWIDRGGERVPYKDIKPGDEIQQRSFENHYWVIADSDAKTLGLYRTTYQDGRILVDQRFF